VLVTEYRFARIAVVMLWGLTPGALLGIFIIKASTKKKVLSQFPKRLNLNIDMPPENCYSKGRLKT
jgi:hypothetical protein